MDHMSFFLLTNEQNIEDFKLGEKNKHELITQINIWNFISIKQRFFYQKVVLFEKKVDFLEEKSRLFFQKNAEFVILTSHCPQ